MEDCSEKAGAGKEETDVHVGECHLRGKSLVLMRVHRTYNLAELWQTEKPRDDGWRDSMGVRMRGPKKYCGRYHLFY